jgi:TRAP transporter 4TM/12TM fusion protein
MTLPTQGDTEQLAQMQALAKEVEEKHQEGGVRRQLTGNYRQIVRWTMIISSLFNLYTTGISAFSTMDQRGIHLLLMMTPVCLLIAATPKSKKNVTAMDLVLTGLSVAVNVYTIVTWRNNVTMLAEQTPMDLIMGTIMIIMVLECARRTTGPALPTVTLIFLAYVVFGPYLPGVLSHPPVSYNKLISFMYQTTEGIYGSPIGISATYLVIFVLFGSVLKQTGAGQFFIDMNYSWAGRFRGGPAKTAVVASSLMGMISGSPLANVVTVGTFTIPLMKHAGYQPYVAAAIEALSSTGGCIMPPVMGAAAFIMADYLGMSYGQVCVAAIIPAILYYVAVFMFTDLEALKYGMTGLPKEKLPQFVAVMKNGWYLLMPIILLVVLLLGQGSTPMMAAFWSIIAALVLGVVQPFNRLNVKKLLDALEDGSKEVIPVATCCAAAGIIVGALGVTGLGVKFTQGLLELSGGNPFIALVLTMIAALILGMGMPITAVYILLAALAPAALLKMGIPLLSSHMFIFYFSAIAGLTPPVALTAYAAAGLAGSDPTKTGWTAFAYGIVAYIVPFMFVYSQVLLMRGPTPEIILGFVASFIGVVVFSYGLHSYISERYKLGHISRLIFVIGGLLLILPGLETDIIGAGLAIMAWLVFTRGGEKPDWHPAAMAVG